MEQDLETLPLSELEDLHEQTHAELTAVKQRYQAVGTALRKRRSRARAEQRRAELESEYEDIQRELEALEA